jgi:hypothetical protein
MKIFWGFVLVLFGLAYLGASFNWWGYDIPNSLWQFWPLLFVFLGLDLLTRNTSFYIPVMIIALILSSGFIYISYFGQANRPGWMMNEGEVKTRKSEVSVDLPKEAKEAEVTVETGAIEFNVSGSSEKLMEGLLESTFAEADVKESMVGSKAVVSLSTVNTGGGRMWSPGMRHLKNNLNLKLNKKLPLNLIVESGASDINLDLTEQKISGLSINTGASSVNVAIGPEVVNGAKLNVEAGASAIDFQIPSQIGVKMKVENGLTSRNFTGYTEKDGFWYSAGYDQAKTKIELNFQVGASSLRVGN